MNSKAKLILHPVRMKIVQTLIGKKELNVQEIQARLTEVPQATLYRHLNKLLEADVIHIVKENRIRGTIEKFYALNEQEKPTPEDFQKMNREEHLNLFLTFMTHMLGQYEAYLQQDEIDLVKDGVSFRQAMIYLSDQEFQEFISELSKVFLNVLENEPTSERKARLISTIMIPDIKK